MIRFRCAIKGRFGLPCLNPLLVLQFENGKCSGLNLANLLGRDADRAIQRDAGAVEESGKKIALVALGRREIAPGIDRASAFSGENKG